MEGLVAALGMIPPRAGIGGLDLEWSFWWVVKLWEGCYNSDFWSVWNWMGRGIGGVGLEEKSGGRVAI
jgi:hypothetical protein